MAIADNLEEFVPKEARVLVVGTVGNSLAETFHLSGYANVYGLDCDKQVYQGRYNKSIRYLYGDPGLTHFPNSFFGAVILDQAEFRLGERAKRESARVVANGGVILFRDGEHESVTKAGPVPMGEVDILACVEGHGGIAEYSRVLQSRMEGEWGVSARLRTKRSDVRAVDVVVQFENGLPNAEAIIGDALGLADSGHRVYFDVHSAFTDFGGWNDYLPELEAKTEMLYRANEIAEADGVAEYTLFPHISYKNVPELALGSRVVKLGSFGFASRGKRHDELIYMARRLRVPLTLLLSVNTEVSKKVADDMEAYIESLQRKGGNGVEVLGGFFSYEEIEERLADCSHLIFTTKNALSNSGSIQLAKRLNRPILSLQSFQAQQAQVHQFESLTDWRTEVGWQLAFIASWMKYALKDRPDLTARLLRSFFKKEKRGAAFGVGMRLFSDLYRTAVTNRTPISRAFIESHRELSRDEDGLDYLYHALVYPDPPGPRLMVPRAVRGRPTPSPVGGTS